MRFSSLVQQWDVYSWIDMGSLVCLPKCCDDGAAGHTVPRCWPVEDHLHANGDCSPPQDSAVAWCLAPATSLVHTWPKQKFWLGFCHQCVSQESPDKGQGQKCDRALVHSDVLILFSPGLPMLNQCPKPVCYRSNIRFWRHSRVYRQGGTAPHIPSNPHFATCL